MSNKKLTIAGEEAYVGMPVYDSWWPLEEGKIYEVLKTRIKVLFPQNVCVTYDKSHLKFLKRLDFF